MAKLRELSYQEATRRAHGDSFFLSAVEVKGSMGV